MNENEIVVLAKQTPGIVTFDNFIELKSFLQQGLAIYNETEYTVNNIEQAEEDLKVLKNIKKKLYDKKKELEKAYSLPIEEVSKQLDELIDMVKEPMDIIDKMIKDNNKQTKQIEIMNYAKKTAISLGEYADNVINSSAFFNTKWLNATCKTKEWQADVDKRISDAANAIETIKNIGGNKTGALLGFYFDKLSLEGADQFLEFATADVKDDTKGIADEENAIVGYKVLKIYGTERQMVQFITQLDLSNMEYEEIEDGMPKDMKELTEPTFDSFVAFDIEHTGTYGIDNGDAESEIIEIGAVKVVGGVVVEKFDMLANPGRKIVPRVARLTHITDEMVKNEPSVEVLIKAFKEFVGDNILVGHNIKSCDLPHIKRAAKKAGINFDNSYLDTKKLAYSLKEKYGWEKINLSYLSNYYNVKLESAHRAWCDAEANAYVYIELKKST